MTNKTYNQYCAIAQGLDVVGERWTLLIVRNLLLGPKRFSDLMHGLPGISTNILTDRLKLLEEQAVVTTRFLPPPAASTVYQLTENGFGLADVLSALARWGSYGLGKPTDDQHIVPESIWFMVMGVFRRAHTHTCQLTCDFHVKDIRFDHHFGVVLSAQGMTIADQSIAHADITLQIDLETLSLLSSARITLSQLIGNQRVTINGTQDATHDLIKWVDGTAVDSP